MSTQEQDNATPHAGSQPRACPVCGRQGKGNARLALPLPCRATFTRSSAYLGKQHRYKQVSLAADPHTLKRLTRIAKAYETTMGAMLEALVAAAEERVGRENLPPLSAPSPRKRRATIADIGESRPPNITENQ